MILNRVTKVTNLHIDCHYTLAMESTKLSFELNRSAFKLGVNIILIQLQEGWYY